MFKAAATEQLKVPGHINHLGDLRDFVTQIGQKYNLPAKLTKSFKLAVDEAATNIIYHAYKDQQSFITIRAIVRQKSLTIVLIDQGTYFHPKWAEDPDIKSYAERGERASLGLFMIRRLIDHIDYRKTEAGNELHLTKYFAEFEGSQQIPRFVSIPAILKTKHFVTAVALVTVICASAYAFLYSSVDDTLSKEFVAAGKNIATQIANQLDSARPQLLSSPDRTFYVNAIVRPLYEEHVGKIYSLALEDSSGTITWSTNPNDQNKPFARPTDRTKLEEGRYRYVIDGNIDIHEFEKALADSFYTAAHVLLLQDSLENAIESRRMFYLKLTAAGLIVCYILLVVFGYFVMNPVRKLSNWVNATRQGEQNEMDIDSSSEIGAIAQAFNDITQKFKESQKHLQDQEHLEKEIQLAKDIQSSLLPKAIPQLANFEIAACYEAAQTVGGDYYDFIQLDDDKLGVVIADVAGKGVPGSLVMTMIRTALRTEARGVIDAAEVLAKVNDFIIEDIRSGMFVTVMYLILDTKTNQVNFASAGHTPLILHRRQTQKTFYLNPVGFPIGVQLPKRELFFHNIQSETIQLQNGDTLVLYTDGVTEAMNPRRELFGEERLLEAIREHGALPANSFVEKLKNRIYSFREDGKQFDDITLVTIRQTQPPDAEESVPVDDKLSVDAKFLSIEDVTKIMDVLVHHPDYDAHDISQELNTRKYGYVQIPEEKITAELNRRQLYNIRLRRQFVTESKKTNRSITPPGTAKLTVEGETKGASPKRPPAEMSPELEADFVFGNHIDDLIASKPHEELEEEPHEEEASQTTPPADAEEAASADFPEEFANLSEPTIDAEIGSSEEEETEEQDQEAFFLDDISDRLIDSILEDYGGLEETETADADEEPEPEISSDEVEPPTDAEPASFEIQANQELMGTEVFGHALDEDSESEETVVQEEEVSEAEDEDMDISSEEGSDTEQDAEEVTTEIVPEVAGDTSVAELLTHITADEDDFDDDVTSTEIETPAETPPETSETPQETAEPDEEPDWQESDEIHAEMPSEETEPPAPEYESVFVEEGIEVGFEEELTEEPEPGDAEADSLEPAEVEDADEATPPLSEFEDKAQDSTEEKLPIDEQLLLQGIQHYKNHEFEDALIAFRKVVKIDPENAVAYQLLGNAFYRNNMFREAIETYEIARRFNPDDATLNENLGMIYAKLGQYEEAYQAWQVVLQNHPERREIMTRLQRLQKLINGGTQPAAEAAISGEHPGVEADHGSISEYEDDSEDTNVKTDLMNTGIEHYRRKEYDAAIDVFKNIIELFPDLKETYTLLGNAYFRNNMVEEAAEIYELLTQMDTEDSTTYENKGAIYAKNGLYQQALKEWKKVLSHYPERSDIKRKIENVEKML